MRRRVRARLIGERAARNAATSLMAVEVLGDAVADGARIVAEQRSRVATSFVTSACLVALERLAHLGHDVGQVDVHGSSSFAGRGAATACSFQRVRDAQRHVLAPGRGDDLHADRQRRRAAPARRPPAGR